MSRLLFRVVFYSGPAVLLSLNLPTDSVTRLLFATGLALSANLIVWLVERAMPFTDSNCHRL
jgi:hypothetical protein